MKLGKLILALPVLLAAALPAQAEWVPEGPIRLMIGFGAGGGTDIQARTLAQELEERTGWRVLPENVPGGGGTIMAAQLKNEPADGTVIGLAINTTFDFEMLNAQTISPADFTYIVTTAASQMALLARPDSGWDSIEDMVAAAQSGTPIVWASYSELMEAAAEVVARHFDINVSHLRGSGGKFGVDALVARDANLAWAGGAQGPLVAAGELEILASAEDRPLAQAPDAPTLIDLGIDHTFGFQFVLAGPADLDPEAREAITAAVTEILEDPDSRTYAFIQKQYPPAPVIKSGDALQQQIMNAFTSNGELLKQIAQ